jgi:hypothetical protein
MTIKVLSTEEPQNPAGDEMQVHQDTFLRNALSQQKLADIDVHVSALVALLGNRAASDAGFRIKTTIEDMIYQSTLYKDKDVTETEFPRIRTAMDQHATRSTDRKAAIQSVRSIHVLLGCQAEFSQPYAFFLDTESMYGLFNTQYDSNTWSRKTIELKRQHICQFLEMVDQRDLKGQYYEILQSFIDTLPVDARIPTLERDTVTEIHDDIKSLYEEAVELLENPEQFQFEYYERGRGPLQVAMDALVLLYIWGQHPTHTNDRRLLQTWVYRGADTNIQKDNFIDIVDDQVTVHINYLTKKESRFEPFTLELTETDPELANLLKMWRPIAQKFQCGNSIDTYLKTQKVTRSHVTPNRTSPYVLFQYDYSSCNKSSNTLGAPLGTVNPRNQCIMGNGFQKQAKAAGKRLGYEKETINRLASCNAARHVNVAATRPVNVPTAEEQSAMEDNARRSGSSVRAQTRQYAQDCGAGEWQRRTRPRTDSQETLTGISDEALAALDA